MKLTKVRRIEGNLGALRGDLEYVLQMTKEQVVINQLTRQIIVKVCIQRQNTLVFSACVDIS